MLPKKPIRRNTIVRHKEGTFYGRVIRVLPNGDIFWLCCGYHFHISPPENLVADGYKGSTFQRWDSINNTSREHYSFMTTLRRLKISATRFHHRYAHNTPLDYKHIRRH